MLPVSALSSCTRQAGSNNLPWSECVSPVQRMQLRALAGSGRACPGQYRTKLRDCRLGKLLLAPQASGRDPLSWFLSSHSVDRLVICAQEGGRLLQQTSFGIHFGSHARLQVRLCMQGGASAGV